MVGTATFDLTISDGEGDNEPADGLSFNYGNAELGELGSAEEGMAGIDSVTENISFEIDTWMNVDSEQGVNIAENDVAAPSYGKQWEPFIKTNIQTCISIANKFHCS